MTARGEAAHDPLALGIDTFSNARGGNIFYKAAAHPLAAEGLLPLLAGLADQGPVALYDPAGHASDLAALYDLGSIDICGAFAQKIEDLGKTILGHRLQPVTDLPASGARTVFVPSYDSARLLSQIEPLIPANARVASLDAARLPDDLLSDRSRYLAPLNFATNFAFFRDGEGLHTRLVTANYWSRYGAETPSLWCRLFAGDGAVLATWTMPLPHAGGTAVIDSREIRDRFRLGDFAGQLFLHPVGIAGHDLVKYALDVWGDEPGSLSCTHDANAWPADRYAGLPAPAADQSVVLWIQNSHPRPIPPGAVGLAPMGCERFVPLDVEIGPYASRAIDTRSLLPEAEWPVQVEVRVGKHVVRPRYEVRADARRWLAHVNVERGDLSPDPAIPESSPLLGKGFILPAPILPLDRWRTSVLPTPMARSQRELPIAVILYGPDGEELTRRRLGRVGRSECPLVEIDELLADRPLTGERPWGHLELVYDFSEGGEADGWLHGIFRYIDRRNAHAADTSFGSHIFNTAMTFRREPQSYSGPPPGLSTRLFVRLGLPPLDTMLHLIYPASRPWRALSSTTIELIDGGGRIIAERHFEIPCGGSRFLHYGDLFAAGERAHAGHDAHVLVRDPTCRLFGYHGLVSADEFCLDHMFGF